MCFSARFEILAADRHVIEMAARSLNLKTEYENNDPGYNELRVFGSVGNVCILALSLGQIRQVEDVVELGL